MLWNCSSLEYLNNIIFLLFSVKWIISSETENDLFWFEFINICSNGRFTTSVTFAYELSLSYLTYDIILYWLQFMVWFVQHKMYRSKICINKCISYELTWRINIIESNLAPHNNNYPCSDRWSQERSLELSLFSFKISLL